jgi:predicted phosphoadenosine phosphosulfate sulfurtransferase
MAIKRYRADDVLTAARRRIAETFDSVERVYLAFSGGKDSSVLFHLVMEEAIKRGQRVGVMFIDFEAQYAETISHVHEMFELYKDHIEQHWICIPMLLRNAVTNFEPRWVCWDEDKKPLWIRDKPAGCTTEKDYPFAQPQMEFEEFIVLFGQWYGQGKRTAGFIGIRAQESLHRYCAVATWEKRDLMMNDRRWTTKIVDQVYNVYPIYDWTTEDIWTYYGRTGLPYNRVYDMMHKAGLSLPQMRICQPYGDDQRRGLNLFHVIEPETWTKIVARVSGANQGALYAGKSGNVLGNRVITRPASHATWKSYAEFLLASMPDHERTHYSNKIAVFLNWYKHRGYPDGIPDEADPKKEAERTAPSWRRICKTILKNDRLCKGLGFTVLFCGQYRERWR